MDLISILTTVILTTTIVTVVTGLVAYGAFKLRDKRKVKAAEVNDGSDQIEAIFLTPYIPSSDSVAKDSSALFSR